MRKGLRILYKDDTLEYYDPIQDFNIDDLNYSFWVGGYTYTIAVDDVLEYSEYDVCEDCGFELTEDGCERCTVERI